jgi:DNA-binding CsgD family transcriptional regulator
MDRAQGALRVEIIRRPSAFEMGALVEAIGTPAFPAELLRFLNRETGVEHYCVFQLGRRTPRPIVFDSVAGRQFVLDQSTRYLAGGCWRQDPTIDAARLCVSAGEASVLRLEVDRLPHGDLRDRIYGDANIRERIMICGGARSAALGLSVLRSSRDGRFDGGNLRRIRHVAGTLLALVGKHAQLAERVSRVSATLTSLVEIERNILVCYREMPRREAQVCARILYGLSGGGIALDLGISEQTVMTYRKRAYGRLGIATHRELLLWYLDLWRPAGQAPRIH